MPWCFPLIPVARAGRSLVRTSPAPQPSTMAAPAARFITDAFADPFSCANVILPLEDDDIAQAVNAVVIPDPACPRTGRR